MERIFAFLSGGIVGGFIGGFTKFLWEKWLPDWMTWRREQKVEREKLMSQFRGPAIRAIADLQSRIYVILDNQAGNYQYLKRFGQDAYYVESATFLIARCFAWHEILRDKMAAYDYAELFKRLEEVTHSFSAGRPGFQIFWLEQREIGERMLKTTDTTELRCLGYSEFLDSIRSNDAPECFKRLRDTAERMLEGYPKEIVRLTRIQGALVDTIAFIDPDFRWVAKNMRTKLNAEQLIQDMLAEKVITKTKAESLMKEAKEAAAEADGAG